MKRLPQNFNPGIYLALNPDVARERNEPGWHYLNHGAREGRLFEITDPEMRWISESGLFDPDWYAHAYPDVANAKIDPLAHWYIFGHRENRDPSINFSVSTYRRENPDCHIEINPLLHQEKSRLHGGIADHRRRLRMLQNRKAPTYTPNGVSIIYPECASPDAIRNLAVIKLDHFGDAFMSLDAIERLRKNFPASSMTIYCAPFTAKIFQKTGAQHIETLDIFQPGGVGSGPIRKFSGHLPQSKPDLAIDLREGREAAEVLFSIGARLTSSFDFLSDYGIPQPTREMPNNVRLNILTERVCSAFKSNSPADVPSERSIRSVALNISGSIPAKRWPLERWVDLAHLLQLHGYVPHLLGSPEDVRGVLPLTNSSGLPTPQCLPVDEFAEWVVSHTDVYVGLDTGMTHAMARAGHPVIEIIGGYSTINQWLAYGPNVIGLHRQVGCSPCMAARDCFHPHPWYCLEIPLTDIVWTIQNLLDQ